MAVPSLPPLEARVVTLGLTLTTAPSAILQGFVDLFSATTYDDGTPRDAANGWQPTAHSSAGLVEAVELDPPSSSPLAGEIKGMLFGAAAGVHTPLMLSPDTYANGSLYGGLYLGSSLTYSAWDSATPFTGSGARLIGATGLWSGSPVSVQTLRLVETLETALVTLTDGAGVVWAWFFGAGLVGLSDQAGSSEDGRIYTLATAPKLSANQFSAGTGASNGALWLHDTTAIRSHAYYVVPGTATGTACTYRQLASATGSPLISNTAFLVGLNGEIDMGWPIKLRDNSTLRALGTLRGWAFGPQAMLGQYLGTVATPRQFVALSSSVTVSGDALYQAVASN